jgi:ABC-type phosphate/phosphonate transport system permease subunit
VDREDTINKINEEKQNLRILIPFIIVFVIIPFFISPVLIMILESDQNFYFEDYFNSFTYVYGIFFDIDLTEERVQNVESKIVVAMLGIIRFIFLGFIIALIISIIRIKFLNKEMQGGSEVLRGFRQ